MKKYPVLLASIAGLATINLASAQGLPPTLGGTAVGPGYTPPGYIAPGSTAPSYAAPGSTAPSIAAPGYMWREQRANEDWRNNTWREQRANEDWRSNNWRQQRANEDWRQRELYEKEKTPNNAIDRGYVKTDETPKSAIEAKKNPLEKEECGVGTVKSALPCPDYAKDKAKNSSVDPTKNNAINRGYGTK